jgi:hypothetical protein
VGGAVTAVSFLDAAVVSALRIGGHRIGRRPLGCLHRRAIMFQFR